MNAGEWLAFVLAVWLLSIAVPSMYFAAQDAIRRSRSSGFLCLLRECSVMAGSRIGGLLLAYYVVTLTGMYRYVP